MTYPSVPLGQQFHRKRLADDTSDVAPNLSLHNAIDVPLNAAAAAVRAAYPSLFAYIANGGATLALAANSTVPWDAVALDNYGGWDPVNHQYVCPKAGVYLVSVSGNVATATSGGDFHLNTLDSTIYPTTSIVGTLSLGTIYDQMIIPPFPMICNAGDIINISTGGTAYSVHGSTSTTGPRCWLSIQYVGAWGANVPDGPPDTNISELWTPGETVNDLKLDRRFTDPMNYLQPYIANFGENRSLFIAGADAQTVSVGAPITWDPVIDTAGALSADGTTWNSPGAGLYLASVMLIQVTSGMTIQAAFDTAITSYGESGSVGSGAAGSSLFRVRPQTGRQLTVDPYETFTVPSGTNQLHSFFAVTQLA